MSNIINLKPREEAVMNILWDHNIPMTTNDILKNFNTEECSEITLYKTIQSLVEKGYLEVAGLVKCTKTYSRQFVPAISKEQYYSSLLISKGLNKNSLADLTAAFLGVSNSESKNAEVISALEEIIATLKER